ncbi:MAG: DNA polymerase [Corynebacterium sp.]|uniref:DNA polymerase n=1 Tax=Corynebacterium sp. TaxID=1720 RepID=UPI003F093C5C
MTGTSVPTPPTAEVRASLAGVDAMVLDETVDGYKNMTEARAAELAASAIPPEIAEKNGLYSAASIDDLPEGARWLVETYGEAVLPALVVPRVEADGRETWQVKPLPVAELDAKYISPSGDDSSRLACIREVDRPEGVLIVEGTKQSLSVGAWAPDGWSVYAIQGILGWMHDGVPTPLLRVVKGSPVVIIPDSDAAANLNVYEGAEKLGHACATRGASSVKFAQLVGGGNAGIDDMLGAEATGEDRRDYLEVLVNNASAKPAKTKPKKRGSGKPKEPWAANDERPLVQTDGDPREALVGMRDAAVSRYGGDNLFRRGATGVGWLHHPEGDHLRVREVEDPLMLHILAESARLFVEKNVNGAPTPMPGTPSPSLVRSVLATVSDRLPELAGVTHTPYVRSDGVLVLESGYDDVSKLILSPSDDLLDLDIPDHPTDEEVNEARELIDGYMMHDFLFREQSDRANAFGSLITELVRPMMPTSPMFVLNGNNPGVGKGLLVDIIALIFTGETSAINKLPEDDVEVRKNLLSSLRAGETLLVYDEVATLKGLSSLNAFVTAVRWSDRVLGVSEKLNLLNATTVFIAGNNVEVPADAARRSIPVRLYTDDPHPEKRTDFLVNDLKRWVSDNRARILSACLTLVQAWLDRGRPKQPGLVRPGSFETWADVVGGILYVAGIPGFLDGLDEQRAEADWTGQCAQAHLEWLEMMFSEPFSAREAADKISEDVDSCVPDGVTAKPAAAELGTAWRKMKDRWFGPYRLVRAGVGHKKVNLWRVEVNNGGDSGADGDGSGGPVPGYDYDDEVFTGVDGDSPTAPVDSPSPAASTSPQTAALAAPTGVSDEQGRKMPEVRDVDGAGRADLRHVSFDIETASADDLYTYGPGFCRLAGYAIGSGPVQLTTDMDELCEVLRSADRIVAHNAIGFDLAALAHWHGLDVDALVAEGRVRDTLLMARQADPPDSGKGGRTYDLDSLGERLVSDGKASTDGTSDLKRLAKEHGSYDRIPVDNEEYRAYLVQDVELLRKVYAVLPCDEYVLREHRVMWALEPISRVGLRLDVEATQAKVAEGEAIVERTRAWLAETWGLPAEGKAPQQTKLGKQALTKAFATLGIEPEWTKTGALATGKDALAVMREANADNPRAVELLDALQTINGVRPIPQTLLDNVGPDGHVHPNLSAGQGTGRLSLTRPGLTVMGKRDRANVLERALLLPDTEDERLISVDLSQIDARAVAALCGDPAYLAMYEPGRDAHTELAVALWGDAGRRSDAKAVGHASNYGMGASKLAKMTGKPHSEAQAYLATLAHRFPGLESWKTQVRDIAKRTGLLQLPSGRWARVSPDRAWTGGPAGMGQGTARDLLMDGILRLPRWLRDRLRAIVHDEVVLSVPADRVDEAHAEVLDALQFTFTAPDGGTVEVLADTGGAGRDWADVYRDEHPDWPEVAWAHRRADS